MVKLIKSVSSILIIKGLKQLFFLFKIIFLKKKQKIILINKNVYMVSLKLKTIFPEGIDKSTK